MPGFFMDGEYSQNVVWLSVAHPPRQPLVDALRLFTLQILFGAPLLAWTLHRMGGKAKHDSSVQ